MHLYMSTQSFDVSFYNKDLTWNSNPTANINATRGWQSKKDAVLRLDAKGMSHIDFNIEGGLPNSAKPSDRQRPDRVAISMECQVCTVAALVILVSLHMLVMYELAAIIISIYFIVLTPLIGTFYSVSLTTQVHLYVLHLSAVVILSVNMRFKRDFSFLFLCITSVILSYVCLYGGSWKRKDDVASLLEHRCRGTIVTVVLVNVFGIYFLWERSHAKEYNPQLHAFQALLLLLNLAVYIYACT
jgi:hypothetical protein